MHGDDRKKMLEKWNNAHTSLKEVISEENLDYVIFTESGWSVRDILGHIATWDREVTKSLKAILKGDSYLIVDLDDDESDFNGLAVQEQRKLSKTDLLNEWNSAQGDLVKALNEIPLDKFPGDFEFPWGDENGTILLLIEYMLDHKLEHREEIIKALNNTKS
jgi:hypothetical protein